jgi:hypothetical protein
MTTYKMRKEFDPVIQAGFDKVWPEMNSSLNEVLLETIYDKEFCKSIGQLICNMVGTAYETAWQAATQSALEAAAKVCSELYNDTMRREYFDASRAILALMPNNQGSK